MKMTLICMKMKLHTELIFICKVLPLDSFETESQEDRLGNGLLKDKISSFPRGVWNFKYKNGVS